jgi:hypothetical protein
VPLVKDASAPGNSLGRKPASHAWRYGGPALTLLLVSALGGASWWLTHPNQLEPVGSSSVLPLEVGQPVVLGTFARPRNGTVTVTDAVAKVRENTADADVRVLLCETAPGSPRVGSQLGRAEDACTAVLEPAGQVLAARGGLQVVLEVVPRRSGVLVVDGVDISYRDGWRRGTQPSGLVAEFPVSGDPTG